MVSNPVSSQTWLECCAQALYWSIFISSLSPLAPNRFASRRIDYSLTSSLNLLYTDI